MIKHLLLLMSIIACSIIQAQSLTGKVTDIDGQPVAFVNIKVLNNPAGTVADVNGHFHFPKRWQLSIAVFCSRICHYSPSHYFIDLPLKLDVTLIDQAQALSEMVITANKMETDLQKHQCPSLPLMQGK